MKTSTDIANSNCGPNANEYFLLWMNVRNSSVDLLCQNSALRKHHYLRRTAKVMFSTLLVREFVCLCFCLSFNNIAGKPMDKFSWNLQDMLGKIQWTIWIYLFFLFIYLFIYLFFFWGGGVGGMFNLLHTGFCLICFQGNPFLWAT